MMDEAEQIEQLVQSLDLLVRRLGTLERFEAANCNITLTQCRAIVEIGRTGKLSVHKLAELISLDESTVSRLADKLVIEGLVEKEVDPDNHRYVVLSLAEKGFLQFEEIEKLMADYFREIILALPLDKREQIIESLEYLSEAVKAPRCRWPR